MPKYDGNDIYYTMDGSDPVIPETGNEPVAPTYKYEDEFLPTLDATAIKAVAVLTSDHTQRSPIVTLELEQCATPVPEYHGESGSVILSTTTEGAHICYSTTGETPALSETNGAEHEVELTTNARTAINAVAVKRGWRKSEPFTATLVFMPTITLEGGDTYTYTGEEITPSITSVQVAGESEVIPAADYVISSYYNNTNHGTAQVVITESENCSYKIYGIAEYTINQAALKSVQLSTNSVMYNHLHQTPVINSVTAGEEGTITVDASHYEMSISPSEVKNKGDYTVTVTAKSNSNFTGSQSATFTIIAKPLTHDDININVTKEGNSLMATVTDGGNVTLTEGTDYTFSDTADGEYHEMTFTGMDNYSDTRTMTFVDVPFVKVAGDNVDYAATFAAKTDMATPAGMTAYIVTGLNAKQTAVELQAVDYLPEDVPVLLLSSTNVDGFAKDSKGEGGSASVDGNKLKKTTAETHFDTGKIYLFYKGEFVLNAEGNLAANKVYLDLGTAASPAPRLAIISSELMGIGDIRTEPDSETEGRWYRMDGLQLTRRPTAPGLYLHNGKKRVIGR